MCVWFAATSWSAPCDSADFYSGLDTAATGTPLRNALRNLVGSHNVIPYTSSATDCWDALNVLEQDPEDALNVTLVYSLRSEPKSSSGLASGWNREHVRSPSLCPSLLCCPKLTPLLRYGPKATESDTVGPTPAICTLCEPPTGVLTAPATIFTLTTVLQSAVRHQPTARLHLAAPKTACAFSPRRQRGVI